MTPLFLKIGTSAKVKRMVNSNVLSSPLCACTLINTNPVPFTEFGTIRSKANLNKYMAVSVFQKRRERTNHDATYFHIPIHFSHIWQYNNQVNNEKSEAKNG